MAEWLNAPHSKCGKQLSVSGVRIPLFPPRGVYALYFCLSNHAKSRQFPKYFLATSVSYIDTAVSIHAKLRKYMPILPPKQVQ